MQITITTLKQSQGWKLNQINKNGKAISWVVTNADTAQTFEIKSKAVAKYRAKTGDLTAR